MQDLIDRLREYASIRKGELAELITEAVDALERQTCDDAVSRQQAIDAFKKELTTGEQKGKYVTICSAVSFEGAKQILEALPAVQPEIVRCKDCRWGRKISGNIECFVDSNMPTEYHGYEWFCPNGERRTDGVDR